MSKREIDEYIRGGIRFGVNPVTRVVVAQDPMAAGAAPPGGDPMAGMGAPPGGAPMGGAPGGAPVGPTAADVPPAGAESEEGAKEISLEDQIPDDLKASIKQKVKEKVQKKIQEVTGEEAAEPSEEGGEGAEAPAGEEAPVEGAEGVPTEGAEESESEPGTMGEFPKLIEKMSDEQFEELFNKAKSILEGGGEGGEEGGDEEPSSEEKEKASSKSWEEKLSEFEDLAIPEDLTVTAVRKVKMKKQADVVVGHMETDGRYYVSCPDGNVKASLGIPRVHPIAQCGNCPYYGDNGDNSGSNMAQIFCTFCDTLANNSPIRYIPIYISENMESPYSVSKSVLPFGSTVDAAAVDNMNWKSRLASNGYKVLNKVGSVREFMDKFASGVKVKKVAKKKDEDKKKEPVKKVVKDKSKMDSSKVSEDQKSAWLKEGDMGEVFIAGTEYKLKRSGNDIQVLSGKDVIDTIKGVVNYNSNIVRENEIVARLKKDVDIQTKMDNRRAFYDGLKKFYKYSENGGAKQALKQLVKEGMFKSDEQINEFSEILKDNDVWIVLSSDDKKWIKTAIRRNFDIRMKLREY